MSVIDFAEIQIKEYVESKRPPIEIRQELDIGYSYEKKTVIVYEIRPQWDDKTIIHQYPLAKVKYVKSQNVWKIYWMRASGKWESYTPNPEVSTIAEFLKILEEDSQSCFWG